MEVETILKELEFKAVRSSGPGGQHVNKTASKVEVTFNMLDSEGLTPSEKELLKVKLGKRITSHGILSLQCSESRSQHRNKRIAIDRMLFLLKENLKRVKPRKKTKPSHGAIERRLQSKRKHALKKSNRKPPSDL